VETWCEEVAFSQERFDSSQYDYWKFIKVLENRSGSEKVTICEHYMIDVISSVASFVTIINPHSIIFCNDEVDKEILDKIAIGSSIYIPSEHLQ
jgi:hypothetical protein